MITVGLELNDVGVLAAVHDGETLRLIDLNEASPRPGWPAFALLRAEGLLFGQPAEDSCMETPRQVCSMFLEELSLGSSRMDGVDRAPAYSELAYFFLRDLLDRIRERVGPIDRFVLAVPPAFLETEYGRTEKIGLLLGMIGDIGIPLVSLTGIAVTSMVQSLNPLPPIGDPIIHVELFLHSVQISVCTRDTKIHTRTCYRFQQLGFVQMMRMLTDAMADRLLRESAYDISENRRIEQSFYGKVMEILVSEDRSRETLLEIQGGSRLRQMKISRETLRADVAPYVESVLVALDRVLSEADATPERAVVVLSDRVNRIRGIEVGLRERGFGNILKQQVGAAAFGAALWAREREVPGDLSLIPVDESLPVVTGEGEVPEPGPRSVLVRIESNDERAAKLPSHIVVDGMAHSIRKAVVTLGSEGLEETFDIELPRHFSNSGTVSCRLLRKESGVYLDSGDMVDATESVEAIRIGDRLRFSDGRTGAEVMFVYVADN